jgi:hypothetical protein
MAVNYCSKKNTEQMKSVVLLPPEMAEFGLTKVLAGFWGQGY